MNVLVESLSGPGFRATSPGLLPGIGGTIAEALGNLVERQPSKFGIRLSAFFGLPAGPRADPALPAPGEAREAHDYLKFLAAHEPAAAVAAVMADDRHC